MITEITYQVKRAEAGKFYGDDPWVAEMSDGATAYAHTESLAGIFGRAYAHDHTPVVIGACHEGYTVIAALPDGERRFVVVGEDTDLKLRPFITWRMTVTGGHREFTEPRLAFASLDAALADALERAHFRAPPAPLWPQGRL